MLDRGSHMNGCGVVDLVVQAMAHGLFGWGPNRHCPDWRGANHRR